jgi:hypothetical protein
MSYRNAHVPATISDEASDRPLYFQWHHGTDARGDALADGGWEAECAKYPGLVLPLPKGQVKHNEKAILAWYAGTLSVAVLAQETRWFTGPSANAVEVRTYQAGAWSRMRLLVWVQEIDKPAVLTLRASAAGALGRGLKALRNGPLALARRDVPGLPLAAFWLDISAGPRERKGEGSNTGWVTLPVINLPDEDADDEAIRDWLDQRYVGDDMLALFARLPELAQFKQRVAQPVAAESQYGDEETGEAPGGVGEALDAFYREATARGLSPFHIASLLSQAGQDAAVALDLLTTPTPQSARPDQPAPQTDDNGDDFDAMRSASEEPEVKAALAQAAQAPHFPVPQRPATPPAPAALHPPEDADYDILEHIYDLERSQFKALTGFAQKETWGMWQTLATQTLVKLGHGGNDNGAHAFRLVTARLAGADISQTAGNWQAKQSSAKAWLHWLSVKDKDGNPVRPTQVSAKSAKQLGMIFQVAAAIEAAAEEPAF